MAFGLTRVPGTFQGAMNSTLSPGLRKFVLVFFDDILVYRQTYEDHLCHLRLVFEWLARDQWKLKKSKCKFAQHKISYLGHVINEKGVATDPEKVSAVLSWPVPSMPMNCAVSSASPAITRNLFATSVLLLGHCLTCLKKGVLFVWTTNHSTTFQLLKNSLCTTLVLSLPDFSLPFCIETDACDYRVGAILKLGQHPIAFISKALGPKMRGLSTYKKEYLAILIAVEQWRCYLQLVEFTICTDHRSLLNLDKQRLHTPWQ
uniref:Reverse transcriptase domain-containing protein n=1 Tax=Arundo donax TaxID=35708 RepID=A0A0A9GCH9_ARUDO